MLNLPNKSFVGAVVALTRNWFSIKFLPLPAVDGSLQSGHQLASACAPDAKQIHLKPLCHADIWTAAVNGHNSIGIVICKWLPVDNMETITVVGLFLAESPAAPLELER